jgi:glutaminyl-tRNA synthetase
VSFADGAAVLRAKIDLASPNMILRDPVLYRIKHAHHYRTGDAWCLYPLYDYAHPLSDAIEGVTHSLCTLEFDNNRAIYDWLVERLFDEPRPRQYEFARLQLDRTVLSKRKLIALVREGHVEGWDDPRMPTLAGVRRRGVPPEALRAFVDRVGVTKANSRTDPALLDHAVREALNTTAPRVMAVLDPVELQLADPDGVLDGIDGVDAPSFPDDVTAVVGEAAEISRLVPLGRRLWIERGDVALDPPPGFKRLAPGRAVRLRYAVVVHCDRIEQDAEGRIARVHARVLPGSLGSNPPGIKVWAAIHWVDVETGVPAEVRLYDHLFSAADPDADGDFRQHLAPRSLEVRRAYLEPSVLADPIGTRYQFERQGYFWRDPEASADEAPWHRIVTLKDARAVASTAAGAAPAPGAPQAPAPPADAPAADPLAALDPAERAAVAPWVAAGVGPADAALLAGDPALAALLADAVAAGADARAAAPWVVQEARRLLRAGDGAPGGLDGAAIAELLRLLAAGVLHAGSARTVLAAVAEGEGRPTEVVARRGLGLVQDVAELEGTIRRLIAEHPAEAASYRHGKSGLAGFFVGAAMRALSGRVEPKAVQAAVRRLLDEDG